MSQYQRIFLIADPGQRRTPAFERAVQLARTTGAHLHITLFDRDPVIAGAALLDKTRAQLARQAWTDQRMGWLQQQATMLEALGLKVSVDVAWTRAADDILAQVADHAADLVIKDVNLESLLMRVLLTPLDWHLLRECPIPLLLVNSVTGPVPRRVVAAVDVSHGASVDGDLNETIIRDALALAIQCDAELHLVYAFAGQKAMIDPIGEGLGFYVDLYDLLLRQHREDFEALAHKHGVPTERAHFLLGPPVETVAEFARADHSDVVVIGAVRHSLMDRLLTGATAEALLQHIPCNLLAVKP